MENIYQIQSGNNTYRIRDRELELKVKELENRIKKLEDKWM